MVENIKLYSSPVNFNRNKSARIANSEYKTHSKDSVSFSGAAGAVGQVLSPAKNRLDNKITTLGHNLQKIGLEKDEHVLILSVLQNLRDHIRGENTDFAAVKKITKHWTGCETGVQVQGGYLPGHEPVPAQPVKLKLLKKLVTKILPKESDVITGINDGLKEIKIRKINNFFKKLGDPPNDDFTGGGGFFKPRWLIPFIF